MRYWVRTLGTTIALMLFVGTNPAVAAGPTIVREDADDVFVTQFCGFPMEVRTTATGIFHLFFDEDGALERVLVTTANSKLTFTNLVTGEAVWTPSVNMVEGHFNDDGTATTTLRGLFWHLIVPGEGLITADVGRLDLLETFDESGNIVSEEVVFSAGIQENQFLPTVCIVLSS